MKKKYFAFSIILIIFIGTYLYNEFYWLKLKKKPQVYVYESFMGPVNPVLIISDLKYKNELVEYYAFAKKNKDYKSFNFPLKTLPPKIPVYLIEFSLDSTVAKVVSLYYRGKNFGGGFTEGYVSTLTINKLPPPN